MHNTYGEQCVEDPTENTPDTPVGDQFDRMLLAKIAAKDHEAYTQFISRHRDFLRSLALKLFREQSVEDVLQDVELQIYRSAGSFGRDPGARVRAWLASIVKTRGINHYRKDVRNNFLSLDALFGGPGDGAENLIGRDQDPAYPVAFRELQQRIAGAFLHLATWYRDAATAFYLMTIGLTQK